MKNENIGKPVYALIERGAFGFRVVSGIVTGVRYTEDNPVYTIEFGKNRWESEMIANNQLELTKFMELPSLDKIKETHGLKIKFKNHEH